MEWIKEMINTILIREVLKNDFQELAEFLEKNNNTQINRQFNPFPLTRETANQIANESKPDQYYAAILNEKIVGLGMLRGWKEGFSIPSLGLLIDEELQGIGLGRQMTQYLIDEAKKLGCSKIRLTVYASNKTAINLYKSMGFCEVSRTSIRISREFDQKILMCNEL